MSHYALNLFDIADCDEYLADSKRSPAEVAKHGSSSYIWHLLDRLDDLRPLLKL